jgi:hypothetical protein
VMVGMTLLAVNGEKAAGISKDAAMEIVMRYANTTRRLTFTNEQLAAPGPAPVPAPEPPSTTYDFESGARIGISFADHSSGAIVLTEVLEGTLAQQKGVMVGMTLLAVNGVSVKGISKDAALHLVKQTPDGTTRRLTFTNERLAAPGPAPVPPPAAPTGTTSQRFATGSSVFVKRSSGDESIAYVKKYDATTQVYTVELDKIGSGKQKEATEINLREADTKSEAATSTQKFANGSRVFVKRSSGEESFGYVKVYDAKKQVYTVELDKIGSGTLKQCGEGSMRDATPVKLESVPEEREELAPAMAETLRGKKDEEEDEKDAQKETFKAVSATPAANLKDDELLAQFPEAAAMINAGVPREEILAGLRSRASTGAVGQQPAPAHPAPAQLVPQQQQMQSSQLAAPQPTRQQPVSSALPPAAVKSFRSGFFSSGKGNKNDGIDISLPKSLEAQGQEVGRLGQLVRQLAGEGKYKEALESAKQRHVLCEGTYGAEHVLTATCINDVATFVQAFGNFDEAEKLFEKASRIQRKVLGDCHPHSIATLQNLVSLYASKGDMKKKEGMELLVQAMQAAAAASSPQ